MARIRIYLNPKFRSRFILKIRVIRGRIFPTCFLANLFAHEYSSEFNMNLPDLRILPLENLVPHEKTDPRRVNPLTERLRTESVLVNPPIVAPLGRNDPRFVVLDGANRTSAFRALGVPHIVAQVVNYNQVELKTWHHIITGCAFDELMRELSTIPGLQSAEDELMSARARLARREAIAYISYGDAHEVDDQELGHLPAIVLAGANGTDRPTDQRTELLNQLVELYESCSKVQRTTSDNIADARQSYPDASALVVFPRYEPAEILDIARRGQQVPAGITRHVLPLRALRLNYPMEVLRSDEPLARKQGHLTEWIYERVQSRRVRTYSEPTVMFDE